MGTFFQKRTKGGRRCIGNISVTGSRSRYRGSGNVLIRVASTLLVTEGAEQIVTELGDGILLVE